MFHSGILMRKETGMDDVVASEMMETYRINTVAPLMVTRALIDLVKASDKKLIVVISSDCGSNGENVDGDMWAYRASKVAVNSVFKNLAMETAKDGIKVKLIHPGWVQTDMGYFEEGAPKPDLTPVESVTGVMQVIADTTAEGMFFAWDGRPMAW
jgi:NAD(P)-dependent dehydrogenase (short-subunit alcohol dehydrogenase family)